MAEKQINKRPSIYVGKTLEQIIVDIQGKHDNKVSAVIKAVADRYAAIIRRNTPEVTVNEWCSLMDILNGYATDSIDQAVNGISWSLEDAIEMEGLGEKWGIDAAFVQRVADLTYEQRLSIIHVGERFWSTKAEEGEKYREMLIRCGARIAE